VAIRIRCAREHARRIDCERRIRQSERVGPEQVTGIGHIVMIDGRHIAGHVDVDGGHIGVSGAIVEFIGEAIRPHGSRVVDERSVGVEVDGAIRGTFDQSGGKVCTIEVEVVRQCAILRIHNQRFVEVGRKAVVLGHGDSDLGAAEAVVDRLRRPVGR
jgi:hypothetical protein